MQPPAAYAIAIYWSQEDNAFVAEVPELLGCAADGQTYDEVLNAAQEAIDRWLLVAREEGLDIPKPQGRKALVAA